MDQQQPADVAELANGEVTGETGLLALLTHYFHPYRGSLDMIRLDYLKIHKDQHKS